MDLQEKLSQQVEETLTKGARAAMGGKARDKEKPFYPITVLEDVELGMPAYDEELFGPVATLFKFANEKEAIFLANDTSYGLGAAIFTKDYERSMRLAIEKLEVGSCFINDFVKSDPRLPFGGVKSSGYGRELSPFGIREFTNIKTIVSH